MCSNWKDCYDILYTCITGVWLSFRIQYDSGVEPST